MSLTPELEQVNLWAAELAEEPDEDLSTSNAVSTF